MRTERGGFNVVVGSILILNSPHIVLVKDASKSELESHWRQDAAQTSFPVHAGKFKGEGTTINGGFASEQTMQEDDTSCLAVR